jgi:hypothetical protein
MERSAENTECQAFFPVVRIRLLHPLTRKGSVASPPFGSNGGDTLVCVVGGEGPNSDEGRDTLVLYTKRMSNQVVFAICATHSFTSSEQFRL